MWPNLLNSLKVFKPSSSPGPRYESTDDRFALSKEALKIKGFPFDSTIALSSLATLKVSSSFSKTFNPAIIVSLFELDI